MKYFSLILLLHLVACDNQKKYGLHDKVTDNEDVQVHWYEEATSYTNEEIVSVTRGDSTMEVFRHSIGLPLADVALVNRRIVIRGLPKMRIIQWRNQAFGYEVVLDTSISMAFWKKRIAELDRDR